MRRTPVGVLALVAVLTTAASAQDSTRGTDLPPLGFGRLNQEQLSVQFISGDLQIRFFPLDERLLRLLANDGYASLHGLVDDRKAAIDSAAAEAGLSRPGLALVSFFALRGDARFDPGNLSLVYRNQFYRPAAIVPYTSNFGNRQLAVRRSASAIYLFDLPIPVYEQFSLVYGATTSNAWAEVLSRLDRERAWVTSRSQSVQPDTGKRARPN